MKRNSHFALNGEWDYAINAEREMTATAYDGKILVPYSPETLPSGVNRQVGADDYLHYRRFFTLPDGFNKGRVLLNIGACDQVCEVFVNGKKVGSHEGGYLPFSLDITSALTSGENELKITVRDDASSEIYGRGKQSYTPGGIWYPATSGIWQSAWLESVPENYIVKIKLTPDYFTSTLKLNCDVIGGGEFEATVMDNGEILANGVSEKGELTLDVSSCRPWSPDDPELYEVKINAGDDVIESYFGLRSFGRKEIDGKWYFTVNNKPIFHNGLLDQGYFEDGMYTPLSNKRMYDELKAVKDLGYNMLRKHIKTESALWYHYCDCLGILVWQDMINGGGAYSKLRINLCPFINLHINDKNYRKMKRLNPLSRKQFMTEAYELIDTLYNVVSLCLWTPFNEAWGQFDAVDV
ncbi:MAG: glycoside hydrolase family 2 [Clostridia bacterium]|nr:glycoside hydrolase family 2 [Clostridia bacterium]